MVAYWRIRLKNQDGDLTNSAWARSEIGIRYGAWSANEFREACRENRTAQEVADDLNKLPSQQSLIDSGAWDSPISGSNASTARRFFERVTEGDWAVIYLQSERTIALAQLGPAIQSESDHPLNTYAGEKFKYRKVYNKKLFPIAHLPDAYRLVPSQGFSNVHEFTRLYEHVRLLAKHATADEIVQEIGRMPFDQQLDLMGASAWESFCVSWLIMERNFIPTGLSTGRTLKAVDIVGRNRSTGRRIIAQCKKDNQPVAIEEDFINSLTSDDEGYYFAYGGCTGTIYVPDIQVIDGAFARKWAETENGRFYQHLFLGDHEL